MAAGFSFFIVSILITWAQQAAPPDDYISARIPVRIPIISSTSCFPTTSGGTTTSFALPGRAIRRDGTWTRVRAPTDDHAPPTHVGEDVGDSLIDFLFSNQVGLKRAMNLTLDGTNCQRDQVGIIL